MASKCPYLVHYGGIFYEAPARVLPVYLAYIGGLIRRKRTLEDDRVTQQNVKLYENQLA